MYLKQEDDEMKKVGFTIEFGKTEDEKERGENFVSGIEALARMTEKRFSDAVNDAGLEFDAYVDVLYEISAHTDEGDYETAVELVYLLAMLLDENVKEMLEGVIYPDFDDAFAHGLQQTDIQKVMEQNRIELNQQLPNYSQISKIKIHFEEFEKTAKKSIKRFMYQEAKG